MILRGDCMAPMIPDGRAVAIDRTLPFGAGDIVVLYLRPELVKPGQLQGAVKRLATNLPCWVKGFPYEDHPDSEILAILITEQLNPHRQMVVHCSHLLAVHKCIGLTDAEGRGIEPFSSIDMEAAHA